MILLVFCRVKQQKCEVKSSRLMNGVWYFLGDEPGFGREASLANYGDRTAALFGNRRVSRVRSDAPLFFHPQKNKITKVVHTNE